MLRATIAMLDAKVPAWRGDLLNGLERANFPADALIDVVPKAHLVDSDDQLFEKFLSHFISGKD